MHDSYIVRRYPNDWLVSAFGSLIWTVLCICLHHNRRNSAGVSLEYTLIVGLDIEIRCSQASVVFMYLICSSQSVTFNQAVYAPIIEKSYQYHSTWKKRSKRVHYSSRVKVVDQTAHHDEPIKIRG